MTPQDRSGYVAAERAAAELDEWVLLGLVLWIALLGAGWLLWAKALPALAAAVSS